MLAAAQIEQILLTLAHSIIDADSRGGLVTPDNLRELHSSLENVIKGVVAAQNELSPISKLPPEIVIAISQFVAEPRIRKSMFEIVKMTHICQYWRSTLISCPQLWSSIFVKNDHQDFVAACLKRSRELPLTVHLDLKYDDDRYYPDCTCIRNVWSPMMRVDEDNPCRHHTTIRPLLDADHPQRVRNLDVHFEILNKSNQGPYQDFEDALHDFKFFTFPLPSLENLSFSVEHELAIYTYLKFPKDLFCWAIQPPAELRHLSLRGCYGDPIQAVRNLTSFELVGSKGADAIELTQSSFLPFISGNTSLVSLTLSRCDFPDPEKSSLVTPVKLLKLKTLRLTDVYGFSALTSLVQIPALKTLSSLRLTAQRHLLSYYEIVYFQVRAESDDGFQLFYDTPANELTWDWHDLTRGADTSPALVRFEGQNPKGNFEMKVSPLPLFVNAKVLEIGVSFTDSWYPNFWDDVENIGPQLTTLRLEIVEETAPEVATSVKKFVEARLKKGMPLAKLERMEFEGMSEDDEEKAKRLWEEFRAGLDVDQYLVLQ